MFPDGGSWAIALGSIAVSALDIVLA